jgi:hypothetical protein
VHFLAIWYILPRFGIVCQEKFGNPDPGDFRHNLWRSLPLSPIYSPKNVPIAQRFAGRQNFRRFLPQFS